MKKLLPLGLLLSAAASHAITHNFSWNSGFANSGVVPDGNIAGWSDSRTLAGLGSGAILDVNVTLNLTGGWNGDLYAYLAHSTGFSVLLNRPGVSAGDAFGYSDAGLSVVFDDGAANGDIHLYQASASYPASIADGSSWAPDARNVSPMAVTGLSSRTAWLTTMNGLDPNGDWTLFVADLSNGEVSTVASWALQIEVATPSGPVLVCDSANSFQLLLASLASFALFRRSWQRQT